MKYPIINSDTPICYEIAFYLNISYKLVSEWKNE